MDPPTHPHPHPHTQVHDEEESLALRMDLLSALIRGFKDAERVCVPLRALRGDSFVTRQRKVKEEETEPERTNADNCDAGRGCRFKVGAGPGEIEDVLLIYARVLVVTSQVCRFFKKRAVLFFVKKRRFKMCS
jgi:hypothetical protein